MNYTLNDESYDRLYNLYVGNQYQLPVAKKRFFFKVTRGKNSWAVDAIGEDEQSCRKRICTAVYYSSKEHDGSISYKQITENLFKKHKGSVKPCTEEYFKRNKAIT